METRPSFSPPRRDLRPPGMDPGANEVYTERLDALNTKFQRLLEQLSQRLKTAIEVSGADGLVSTDIYLFFARKFSIFELINFSVWAMSITRKLIENEKNPVDDWKDVLILKKICNLYRIDKFLKRMSYRERDILLPLSYQ